MLARADLSILKSWVTTTTRKRLSAEIMLNLLDKKSRDNQDPKGLNSGIGGHLMDLEEAAFSVAGGAYQEGGRYFELLLFLMLEIV